MHALGKHNLDKAMIKVEAIKAFRKCGHRLKSICIKVDFLHVNFGGRAQMVFPIADHVGKTWRDQRALGELLKREFPHTPVFYDPNAMEGG